MKEIDLSQGVNTFSADRIWRPNSYTFKCRGAKKKVWIPLSTELIPASYSK